MVAGRRLRYSTLRVRERAIAPSRHPFDRLPSERRLLQSDSASASKWQINQFRPRKTGVGTFAVPWAVINDAFDLATLPGPRISDPGIDRGDPRSRWIKDASFF